MKAVDPPLHHQAPQPESALIAREPLLQVLTDMLREQEATGVAAIVNLHGINGIGKTSLLRQIAASLAADYPIFWLDFGPEPATGQTASAVEAAELMARHPALAHLPGVVAAPAEGEAARGSWPIGFFAANLAALERRPLLLLLDHLADDSWRWIQEQLIRPLLEREAALVVCASPAPLGWHFWELRERCRLWEMPALSAEETRLFLRAHAREALAASAYALTQGYPLRLVQLLLFLERSAVSPGPARLAADDLDRLSPPTRSALLVAGLLRRVEVPVMQLLLDRFLPGWNGDASPHRVLLEQVLPELDGQGYFEPYRRGQPYRFLPIVRYTVEDLLRAAGEERYGEICRLLADSYAARFAEKPITDGLALNEWLYFSTAAFRPEAGSEQAADWQARLRRLLDRARIAGARPAILVYKDGELMARLNALNLFAALHELLQGEAEPTASAPPLLNSTEMGRLRRSLIDQLSRRQPVDAVQGLLPFGLDALLRAIAELGESFDLPLLQAHLAERWPDINAASVRSAVALLHSSGFIEYHRSARRYALTMPVRYLVAPPERGEGQL